MNKLIQDKALATLNELRSRVERIGIPLSSAKDKTTLVIDGLAIRLLVTSGSSVRKWASTPLDEGLIAEGVIQDPEKVGQAIGELFQKEGIPSSNVITCVSGAHTVHKIISLPNIRQEDLRSAVLYQARREMPVPLEELVMAWQTVSQSEQQLEVFAVGVPRDIVGVFMETLRHAGIRPKALDIKPLALARAADRPTAIICDIEPDSIDVVYLTNYAPAIIRTVYFSDVSTSLIELGSRLANELQRTLRFYNDSNRLTPISPNTSVFIAGSSGDYFSMAEALYGSIEYSIERLNPPIDYPPDFPVEAYAANIGLAIKGR